MCCEGGLIKKKVDGGTKSCENRWQVCFACPSICPLYPFTDIPLSIILQKHGDTGSVMRRTSQFSGKGVGATFAARCFTLIAARMLIILKLFVHEYTRAHRRLFTPLQ